MLDAFARTRRMSAALPCGSSVIISGKARHSTRFRSSSSWLEMVGGHPPPDWGRRYTHDAAIWTFAHGDGHPVRRDERVAGPRPGQAFGVRPARLWHRGASGVWHYW